MNTQQKTEYIRSLEETLETKNVYELFERLTRDLIVHQPANPLEFLLEKLKHPDGSAFLMQGSASSSWVRRGRTCAS
jgi:hypothetical protein